MDGDGVMTLGGTAVRHATEAGTGVRLLAGGMVAWCVGFAAVNVVMEASGRFGHGPLAGYAGGLAVMAWLVVGLKLLGALAAVLTVVEWPRRMPSSARTTLVWGAFGLLALYSAGNAAELGHLLVTAPEQITVRSLAYVVFFAAGAVGYGVLAVSHFRRAGRNRRSAVLGVLGAPVLLGLLLGAAPAVLSAAGLLPG